MRSLLPPEAVVVVTSQRAFLSLPSSTPPFSSPYFSPHLCLTCTFPSPYPPHQRNPTVCLSPPLTNRIYKQISYPTVGFAGRTLVDRTTVEESWTGDGVGLGWLEGPGIGRQLGAGYHYTGERVQNLCGSCLVSKSNLYSSLLLLNLYFV